MGSKLPIYLTFKYFGTTLKAEFPNELYDERKTTVEDALTYLLYEADLSPLKEKEVNELRKNFPYIRMLLLLRDFFSQLPHKDIPRAMVSPVDYSQMNERIAFAIENLERKVNEIILNTNLSMIWGSTGPTFRSSKGKVELHNLLSPYLEKREMEGKEFYALEIELIPGTII